MWTFFENTAANFTKLHKFDKKLLKETDFSKWAEEAFAISTKYIYKGIKEDEPLPQSYIDKMRPIAENQIVIAGNRLAYMLKNLDLSGAVKRLESEPFEFTPVESVPLETPPLEVEEPNFLQ